MLTLLEQQTHAKGTFFSLQPSGHSRVRIEDYLCELEIPNQTNPLEYHTTLIYSEKPCPDMKYHAVALPIWGTAYQFELFGPEKNILVLRIRSHQIESLYRELQVYGPTTNYPDYKPHLTVAKDWSGDMPQLKTAIAIKYDSYVVCGINKDE